MDKYEYRVRAEQIKSLLEKKEYAEAMKVANTIDWKRVKSISMLCTVSEIYKINREYENSREILLLAYERYPTGRMIVYALCELAIKMEEFVQAVEYYKEYVQIAPKDTGRYVLQYKLYEAQDVSIEERIEVLEEFKKRDYRERWAYELSYLYHRIGLGTRCVEECDELILWFGEGKYVNKAMELKMLHEPLSQNQLEKYIQKDKISYINEFTEEKINEPKPEPEKAVEIPEQPEEIDILVKPVNLGRYNTINLQEELAKNIQELWGPIEQNQQAIHTESKEELEATKPSQKPKHSKTAALTDEKVAADKKAAEVTDEKKAALTERKAAALTERKAAALTNEKVVEKTEEENAKFETMLAQEYDGQISLNLPEEDLIEKQITGQLSIEDVLVEWEKMKQDNDQRRMADAKRKSLEQTNDIMSQLVGVIPGLQPMNSPQDKSETDFQIKADVSIPDKVKKPSVSMSTGKIARVVLPDGPEMVSYADLESEVEEDLREIALIPDEDDETEVIEDLIELEAQKLERSRKEEPVEEKRDENESEGIPENEFDLEEEDSEEEDLKEEDSGEEDLKEEDSEEEDLKEEDSEEEDLKEEDSGEDNLEDGLAKDELEAGKEVGEVEEDFQDDSEELEEDEFEESEFDEGNTDDAYDETEESLGEAQEADETFEVEDAESSKKKGRGKILKMKQPKQKDEEEESKFADEDDEDDFEEDFSEELENIFSYYSYIGSLRSKILDALRLMNMTPSTGNLIVTGPEEEERDLIAVNMIKAVQTTDHGYHGKVAKISAEALNKKDISSVLKQLAGGVLFIQQAGKLSDKLLSKMSKALDEGGSEILIVIEDSKAAVNALLTKESTLSLKFNARIDIPVYTNDELVAFAKSYARSQEYAIDEMGILALYTRIGELQTSDHATNIEDTMDILEVAIKHVDKKNVGHLMDILLAKRYDKEDYIILREKDFL